MLRFITLSVATILIVIACKAEKKERKIFPAVGPAPGANSRPGPLPALPGPITGPNPPGPNTGSSADAAGNFNYPFPDVYLVGNLNAKPAACPDVIQPTNVGQSLSIEFEVLEDGTSVNLVLSRLCGIRASSAVALNREKAILPAVEIVNPTTVTKWSAPANPGFPPTLPTNSPSLLNRGIHGFYIDALMETFVVGNFYLSTNRSIRPLGVRMNVLPPTGQASPGPTPGYIPQ